MDRPTRELINQAKTTRARSYFARFRAQSIAGLAVHLCREAAGLRKAGGKPRITRPRLPLAH
jgi:hypothetical protein